MHMQQDSGPVKMLDIPKTPSWQPTHTTRAGQAGADEARDCITDTAGLAGAGALESGRDWGW